MTQRKLWNLLKIVEQNISFEQRRNGLKYFIIIDLQQDFVNGSLANPAAQAIVPAVAAKAKELKERGYTIVATRDTHQSDYLETQEGKNLPVPHCIEHTDGWQVVDEIKPFIDFYVDKRNFGFGGWHCLKNLTEAEMCGTVSEICVASNFATLKAAFPEAPITVHKDLCAGLSEEGHNAAMAVMKAQQAIIV